MRGRTITTFGQAFQPLAISDAVVIIVDLDILELDTEFDILELDTTTDITELDSLVNIVSD
jgi:hypothetical protein